MSEAWRLEGRLHVLTGVISTDDILPARYKHRHTEPSQLAPHVFENLHPGLAGRIAPGDFLTTDATFGIGSSREQAVSALLAAGVQGVIAPSFGRIFFRNSWNLGLLALEVAGFDAPAGAAVRVDLTGGRVVAGGTEFAFRPVPQMLVDMVASGGLLAQLRVLQDKARAPGA